MRLIIAVLLSALLLLTRCGGTLSTFEKVKVPHQYLPLKPGVPFEPYRVEVHPATQETDAFAKSIVMSSEYANGKESGTNLALAASAEEANLLIKLTLGELTIEDVQPSAEARSVGGKIIRRYRYLFRMPLTTQYFTKDKVLLWEKVYPGPMAYYTEPITEDEFRRNRESEKERIREGYYKVLSNKVINDYTKLFYLRNLHYSAVVGTSGPQKTLTQGNHQLMEALNWLQSGREAEAMPGLQKAAASYESMISNQAVRKNGKPVVSVRERAMAYYNCAQAYMWLKAYDKARDRIDQAISLNQQYDSDSTNTAINSDRFMFPALQNEILLRREGALAADQL